MPFEATIYELRHDDGHFVRGSTNNFKVRMKNHKQKLSGANGDFQKHVKESGGWARVTSHKLHEWECADESEMFREEGKYIDEVYENPLCLNMKRAGLTPRCPVGKLYRLTLGDTWVYFGKTRDVYHRMAAHKTQSIANNSRLYKKIRELGGWEKCVKYEILREWECDESALKDAEDELIRREWGNEFLLNSMPASTTPERERELSNERVRRWVAAHPEKAREDARKNAAEWRKRNPDKAREVQKRHQEKRKHDKNRIEYNKLYRERNRDEINRKKREKRAQAKLEASKKGEEADRISHA